MNLSLSNPFHEGVSPCTMGLPFEATLEAIKPFLKPGAVLTDVGSVKGNFVAAVERVFGEVPATVVPGHPIAGSEKSGVTAATEGLFDQHKVRFVCSIERQFFADGHFASCKDTSK